MTTRPHRAGSGGLDPGAPRLVGRVLATTRERGDRVDLGHARLAPGI